jgi:hypothetical protein
MKPRAIALIDLVANSAFSAWTCIVISIIPKRGKLKS